MYTSAQNVPLFHQSTDDSSAHSWSTAVGGNMQFSAPLFSFGVSTFAEQPVPQATTTAPEKSQGTASFVFLGNAERSAGEMGSMPTHTSDEVTALGDLEEVLKFSEANAEGSSGFLSESAAPSAALPASRSGKGSPFQSTLPLSPSSCASSQPHTFPSMGQSPCAPAFFTPTAATAPLSGVMNGLSPTASEQPMYGRHTMGNMFVPLPTPHSSAGQSPLPAPTMISYTPLPVSDVNGMGMVEKPVASMAPPTTGNNSLVRRNVYVSGLPSHFRSNDFRELCHPFGRIEASKLCVDNNSNPVKGYGFALFFDEACAAACIVGLNGREVCGRTLQARYADIAATPKPSTTSAQESHTNSPGGRPTARVNGVVGVSGGRRPLPQSDRSGQTSPVPALNNAPTPMMPSPLMYAPMATTPMPARNVTWMPSQAPQVPVSQTSTQYVLLPQGAVPVVMNTALHAAPTQAPAPAPSGLFYVVDPHTHQVQLCQYPSYMATGMSNGDNAPLRFVSAGQVA